MADNETSIYAALESLALSTHRVTDAGTIPGRVTLDLDPDTWAEIDGRESGYLSVFVAQHEQSSRFRTNVVVVFTRVIVGPGVDLAGLIEHSFTDSRRLPGWTEEHAEVWPPADRHSGWSIQSGTYSAEGQLLYAVTQYAIYQRANVGYLLQATGTTAAERIPVFGSLLEKVVRSVNFDD
ncbi:putative lipoprotein LpqN [Nocardia tenerifensis]|uniref:Putative lipoprotein LpqN n=1 Tax=Nocardia tenerifensis TaxID=228006 RepID=A0A318K9Y6_9NOCA|nr:LpqN/LpqT family lipoprotein [Nocardia tenerifensis]PXX70906.1 putative lipoprotein LpqN [Nocardia tenerifensis]